MSKKQQEFEALAKPLMEWLNNNCNPHTVIIIEPRSAEILSGEMAFVTDEYLVD